MNPRTCKAKGRKGQDEVYNLLLKHGFKPHEMTKAIMGECGDDIKVHRQNWKWSIEVKYQEKMNIWQAMIQAANRAVPILFFRRNRTKWYVCIEAEEFLKLCGDRL